MLEKLDARAREVDEATPEDRNRYADLLRVLAILLVVFGHWLVGFITIEDGRIVAERALARIPATHWLTLIFQVMPLFFFVGGLANAISWDSARQRGESYVDWICRRARRLLRPVVPVFAVWLVLVLLFEWMGMESYLVIRASQVAILPLWFLAAYMAVVTVSPAAYWLHRRLGLSALLLFIVPALAVDLVYTAGFHLFGWANFLFVWGAIHQAGFFWHDEKIPEPPIFGALCAVISFGLLMMLVFLGPYPLSMVGTGEAGVRSNDSPPSIALILLATTQIGLVFALRRRAERFLQRQRPWFVVMATGGRMMTVYLWHMTALVLVAVVLVPTGIWPLTERIDGVWWLLRIPWILFCAIMLAPLIAIFGRFEQPDDLEPTGARDWLSHLKVTASAALAILGLSLVVDAGLYAEPGPAGITWLPLGLFVLGLVGLRVLRLES